MQHKALQVKVPNLDSQNPKVAWAAGLFEGEGSIFINCRSDRVGAVKITMSLRMSDKDTVEQFASFIGTGVCKGPIKATGIGDKPMFEWRTYRWADISVIYALFKPWLSERRKQKFEECINYAKPKVLLKGETMILDCGYLNDNKPTRSGARHHQKINERLCKRCWHANVAYRQQEILK
jgi:hypothetical protein